MAIKDLNTLLKSMNPVTDEKKYVFVSLKNKTINEIPPANFVRVPGRRRVDVNYRRKRRSGKEFSYNGTWSLITCKINSDLEAVGFLAKMTEVLAESGIPVNAISAYYHDHLFVPSSLLEKAMSCLVKLTRDAQDC